MHEIAYLTGSKLAEALAEVADLQGRTLAAMAAEVREVNTEKGWRTGNTTFGEYVALLHSEASEALEAYRDHRLEDATGPDHRFLNDGGGCCQICEDPDHSGPFKPEGVGSEMADVLIRLIDMCDVFGIDLESEYRRKMAFARTRPYQHGGRTLSDAAVPDA